MPVTESNSQGTKVTLRNGTPSKVTQTQSYSKTQSRTTRTYDEKYPWSSFLNIPTFAILFVMVLIGGSLLYYNSNIDTYMPTVDADGVRQPYRVEYLNDQPIAELNGLTLNEVFENNFYEQELPNGVYDEIIDGYKLQRVKKYTLQASDIILLGVDLSEVDYSAITALSGASTWQNNVIDYKTYISGWEEKASLLNSTSGFYTYYTPSDGLIRFIFPKGTYATLAEAQADLAGTVIYYQLATPIETYVGIDTLTKEQMDYYYNLYQEQDGVTFDNYYYLSVDDYTALGQTAVVGFEVMFNEGGIFDSALNLVSTVQDVLVTAVTTLFGAHVLMDDYMFDRAANDLRSGLDENAQRYIYDPPSKIEQIYRALPKWLQPDTWFD